MAFYATITLSCLAISVGGALFGGAFLARANGTEHEPDRWPVGTIMRLGGIIAAAGIAGLSLLL